MPQYLFQMSRRPNNNLARDRVVTTFHIDTDLDTVTPDVEPGNNIAADAAELFASWMPGIQGFAGWDCFVYQHGRPRGTPPVLKEFSSAGGAPAAGGPREVALCLSYYADLNQPRRRGRMYLGPWTQGAMAERPGTSQMQALQSLANGISALGGINVQWVQYSRADGEFRNVTNWFVDNEWDTIRSRGLRPDSRLTGTVSG